jgi:anaerobic selenocysteine-containing dehydrogenase
MVQRIGEKIVRSTCGICQAGCGVRIHVEDNRAIHIEGDPDSPINRGALCEKGLASLEYLYHPDRLKYPLRRKGERGSGSWERAAWDEVLDEVAETFTRIKSSCGPESLVFMSGSFKGGFDYAHLRRFANAFEAPNIATMSPVCYVPRVYGATVTHGFTALHDYEYPPACIIVWGANLAQSRIGEYKQTLCALKKGSRLIVIDPRRIELSDSADLWLRPRPGSDLALALGLINVIINEGLYHAEFVNKWTVGFDKLKDHIREYTPELVEEISWVKADDIRKAARIYANNRPGIIQAGNAIDHTMNNFQTARAVSILGAITGNIGVPGGELSCSPPGIISPIGSPELDLRDKISKELRERRLNAGDELLPMAFYATPQRIVKSILKGEPYWIKAGYIQGGNLLLTYSNARQTYEAFKKLEFLVVADMFMTPTAALADIVLPAATYLEFDSIVAPPYYPVAQVQQKVAQIGECRSDYEILRDLAKRLGLDKYFWESEVECMDYVLKPVGLCFEEFREIGFLKGIKEYRRHERDGFPTPSGKVELFSRKLMEWGFDPMPTYHEPPETSRSDPELSMEFPLVLTSWKSAVFRHSGGRQIAVLRGLHPEPVVLLHPDTAREQGLEDGDWVYVETKRGQIRQRVNLTTDILPRVAGVDYGWWFPEEGPECLYGWERSNINILTDNNPPFGPEMGSPNLRGFLCKITKV